MKLNDTKTLFIYVVILSLVQSYQDTKLSSIRQSLLSRKRRMVHQAMSAVIVTRSSPIFRTIGKQELTILQMYTNSVNAIRPKIFFRANHFRQHLKHSHADTSERWTNMLENAYMKKEPTTFEDKKVENC